MLHSVISVDAAALAAAPVVATSLSDWPNATRFWIVWPRGVHNTHQAVLNLHLSTPVLHSFPRAARHFHTPEHHYKVQSQLPYFWKTHSMCPSFLVRCQSNHCTNPKIVE